MKRIMKRPAGGFTLTELLIVVAIIGILAGMTYGAITIGLKRARMSATRSLIHAIDVGIQNFQADFGSIKMLRGSSDAATRKNVRLGLLGLKDNGEPDSSVRDDPRWLGGPYLDIQVEKHLSQDDNYIFIDDWKELIYFELDPDKVVFNIDRWDLWSLGPDGEGSKNLNSFQSGTYEKRREDYHEHKENDREVNRDNIGNW